MNFDEIFDRIRNRTWIPISDTELVDMIVNANMNGTIDDEEKEAYRFLCGSVNCNSKGQHLVCLVLTLPM